MTRYQLMELWAQEMVTATMQQNKPYSPTMVFVLSQILIAFKGDTPLPIRGHLTQQEADFITKYAKTPVELSPKQDQWMSNCLRRLKTFNKEKIK